MYVQDAMTQFGLRVEDADKGKFTEKLRREILEYSQIKIANMLHNAYLTELEYIDTSKTATSGVLALSSLTYKVLRGAEGILRVKLSSGKYCTRIDLVDLKRIENAYLDGTDDNPLYYVFENKIYVFCTQTNPVIDVYYLKLPNPLYYPFSMTGQTLETAFSVTYFSTTYNDDYFNGSLVYCFASDKSIDGYYVVTDYAKTGNIVTVSPAAPDDFQTGHSVYFIHHPTIDVELIGLSALSFEINSSLHDLIVDYAESEAWKITANVERRNSSLEKVITQIKTLNEKFQKAEGIGIKGAN